MQESAASAPSRVSLTAMSFIWPLFCTGVMFTEVTQHTHCETAKSIALFSHSNLSSQKLFKFSTGQTIDTSVISRVCALCTLWAYVSKD